MKKILILSSSNEFQKNKKYFYPYKGFNKNSLENNSFYLKSFSNKKRIKIYKDCTKVYNSVLLDISRNLNDLHKIRWPKRSWEIYLGHWLRRYVYICYNKIYLIKEILKTKNFKTIVVSDNLNIPLATKETHGIYHACKNSAWESIIFTRIIDEYKKLFKVEYLKKKNKPILNIPTYYEYEANRQKKVSKLKKLLLFLLFKISKLLTKKHDILITHTYLKFTKELILNLKKKQFPHFFVNKKIEYPDKLSNLSRQKLNFKKKKLNFHEKIVRKSLETSLPISCVEGFAHVLKASKSHNYPKKPKKIYTCGNFDQNEIFKMYVAECVSKNHSKYYIGQHGNNYFTALDANYAIELKTCDKFISWGKNKFKNTIPLCNYKVVEPILREKKFLSIICRRQRNNWMPIARKIEEENDINLVLKLIDHLPVTIRKKIIIKLKQNHFSIPDLKKKNCLVDNDIRFTDLMKKTKLAFFNYDSSGFLENLNLDVPTVACWPDLLNHLNRKALADYKKLLDCNIIFKSPKDAANHISKNWKNIDEWWLSKEVRSTVNFFKLKYSKDAFNSDFISKLSKIL
jgi:putative transferase (TIGR04331 family)